MRTTLTLLFLAALVAPVAAQEGAPGRYTLVPVEGGALRLDTQTGAVSLCTADGEASACRPLPAGADAPVAGQAADLEDRLARIETRLSALETRGGDLLSDEKSIDRVMVLADRVMRSFFGLVREMKREMESEEL
jgi:hypothetical protein